DEKLLLPHLERAGIFGPVSHRDASRIWPRAGLPAGRRNGGPDRALASRRGGVRESTATARRHALEHRGGAAGERGARSDPVRDGDRGPIVGLGGGDAQRPRAAWGGRVY